MQRGPQVGIVSFMHRKPEVQTLCGELSGWAWFLLLPTLVR